MRASAPTMRILALLVACSLGGCVTYQRYDRPILPEAPQDKGLVYFYREDSRAEKFDYITRNGEIVGIIVPHSYTFVFSAPGKSRFQVSGGFVAECKLVVEAGQTYFFRIDLKPSWRGLWGYDGALVPVTEDEALPKLKELTFVSLHELEASVLAAAAERSIGYAATTNGVPCNDESSPFYAYDRNVIRRIQARWFELLGRHKTDQSEEVVSIQFELLSDGSVMNLELSNTNAVPESLVDLCERAIIESAPFDPWPDDLRKLAGEEPRKATLTFYY